MRIQSHAASWRAFRAIQRNTQSLRDFVVAELYREAVGLDGGAGSEDLTLR